MGKATLDTSGEWKLATGAWKTTTSMTLGDAADAIGKFNTNIHETMFGDPVEALAEITGFNNIQASSAGAVAAETPLPTDGLFHTAKVAIQVTGMAIGVITGQPLIANACFKSWIHDQVRETISSGIKEVVAPTKTPHTTATDSAAEVSLIQSSQRSTNDRPSRVQFNQEFEIYHGDPEDNKTRHQYHTKYKLNRVNDRLAEQDSPHEGPNSI